MENQLLLEKIGQTKTDRLIRECENIYKENFAEKFPNYFENKNTLKSFSIVTITENKEVKSIGMSKVEDLLTDNFGKWFGAFIYPTSPITMEDDSSTNRTVTMWATGGTWNSVNIGGAVGTQVEVGTGTNVATRQDVALQNPQQILNSSDGGWNSSLGQVDIPATIPSTFSGNISEVGLFGVWAFSGGVGRFLLSRDNISPVVSVIIGQSINVDYKLLLS
jgi:hypothetical protein